VGMLTSKLHIEVNGQLHAIAALPPGKESPVPIGYEAERAPEPVWTRWQKEKSLPLTSIKRA
jgi:hypothetical protein